MQDHRPLDLNAQDLSGATPLHIAANLSRAEIVAVLLAQAEIDDMIKNDAGQTPLDVAGSAECARLIQVSRATFNATYIDLLSAYLGGGSDEQLLAWISKNRARCIDFSVKVPSGSRGTTILHEAARFADSWHLWKSSNRF
jgi:ankyrin repeat protein